MAQGAMVTLMFLTCKTRSCCIRLLVLVNIDVSTGVPALTACRGGLLKGAGLGGLPLKDLASSVCSAGADRGVRLLALSCSRIFTPRLLVRVCCTALHVSEQGKAPLFLSHCQTGIRLDAALCCASSTTCMT